jgi:phosphoribosyl 1,2-cyclic phosphate phosphodiesterase
MTLTVTILGCGSSGGVPRIGNDWGDCDPKNPRNRRLRCSILLSRHADAGVTRVLVDTSPDMREQMLTADVGSLDGVWYTHEHADHTHGIDELRGFFLRQRQRIPIWADQATLAMLKLRFGYCFGPAAGGYPPIVEPHVIVPGGAMSTMGAGGAINSTAFDVQHGDITALGFRVGDMAYTPDLNAIPDHSVQYLKGLDLWIIDALRRQPHISHFSLSEALQWIAQLKPRRAILTNMHNDLDYDTLCRELPENVRPAYSGLKLDV